MDSRPRPLAETELASAVGLLDDWRLANGCLERWFECVDFPSAVAWVEALVPLAEALGHHPDIDIRYRRVRLSLVTHDCGKRVTDWDIELASRIDAAWRGGKI
jgi:4a-hydroxytetrahydrobiopterin dehydratase